MRFSTESYPIRITFQGKTVSAEVILSASNGLCKLLLLYEAVHYYSTVMPIVWIGSEFVDLVHAETVILLI
jgi:hypothetical protein